MTKTISLSDEAYYKLFRIKGKASFSKVILELTSAQHKPSLLATVKRLKKDAELAENIEKIYKSRSTISFKNRLNRNDAVVQALKLLGKGIHAPSLHYRKRSELYDC